jgi:poly(A) polymerase
MTAREFALKVVRRLQQAGFTAYWAGGCVRDQLLGLDPKDYDVATDARPEQIMALFPRHNEIGAAFGVVQVIGPRGPDGQWLTVEVTTFRSDLGYSDGRRPDAVAYSGPQEDAQRRDFTINGMFYDPVRGLLIDYVGGQADLENRLLRAIGNPWERFTEDKLRLLRAVRLAARYQLTIEAETQAAAKALAPQITVVSPERIAEELRKMLSHKSRGQSVRLLRELDLIPPLFPELVPTFSLPQRLTAAGPKATGLGCDSGTVWDHSVSVVDHLPENASFPLALAALLHDIGKPELLREVQTIQSWEGHERRGAALAQAIAQRLRLSNAEKDRIVWLIAHQSALFGVRQQKPHCWRPLLVHPGTEELLALHRAEALANGGEDLEAVDYCESLLRHSPREWLDPPPLLRGGDLLAQGIPPGPVIKHLLDAVRQAQWDGEVHTQPEALALALRLYQQMTPASDPTRPGTTPTVPGSSAAETSPAAANDVSIPATRSGTE